MVMQPETSDAQLVIQAHLEMLNIWGSKEGFLGTVFIVGYLRNLLFLSSLTIYSFVCMFKT